MFNKIMGTCACVVVFLGNYACSSSNNEIQKLDSSLSHKGTTLDSEVGVNSQGQAVVQKEMSAASALTNLQHVNENLKLDLNQQFFILKRCREELALSINGGSGEYPDLTDFREIEAEYEKSSQLGIKNGNLEIVEKSVLKDRLDAEMRFQRDLESFIRTVKREVEKCQFQINELESKPDSQ